MKLIVFLSVLIVVNAVGHWKKVEVDRETVKKAGHFAAKSLSQRVNSPYHLKLVHIHEAREQIVAGVNYRLKVTLGTTTCKKSIDYEQIEKCDLQEGLYKKCDVKIYRNLEGNYKLTNFECGPDVDRKSEHEELGERIMFEDFVAHHNKVYKDDKEKEERFKIFQKNLKKIKLLNIHERGTATYGITQFSDLTEKEFKKHALGFRPDLKKKKDEVMTQARTPEDPIPESFDWRTSGIVSEVKNQGQCGSCWAFSTTGNIEGQWALKTKKLLSLSEQELVDCDKVDQGCNGGLPSNAYKEIIRLGGLEGEKDYPYEGDDEKCALNKKEIRVFINSSVAISKNETEMAQWLVKNGPISIGINANAMQFYFGGISHPWKFLCNPNNLDHGVLIVGYGVHTYPIFKKTMPFWIIKNSWGASWGEQGYYRVYRGDGTCGLNLMATSAVVD